MDRAPRPRGAYGARAAIGGAGEQSGPYPQRVGFHRAGHGRRASRLGDSERATYRSPGWRGRRARRRHRLGLGCHGEIMQPERDSAEEIASAVEEDVSEVRGEDSTAPEDDAEWAGLLGYLL